MSKKTKNGSRQLAAGGRQELKIAINKWQTCHRNPGSRYLVTDQKSGSMINQLGHFYRPLLTIKIAGCRLPVYDYAILSAQFILFNSGILHLIFHFLPCRTGATGKNYVHPWSHFSDQKITPPAPKPVVKN